MKINKLDYGDISLYKKYVTELWDNSDPDWRNKPILVTNKYRVVDGSARIYRSLEEGYTDIEVRILGD